MTGILFLALCHLTLSFPVPEDALIQIQQWGVVGEQQVAAQVLQNGLALDGKRQVVNRIIKTISTDSLHLTLIRMNCTSVPRNHTILRSRECSLEGSKLDWTDRVFIDGKVYLTLGHKDTWIANIPQALAIKVLWDKEVQRTQTERVHLQKECIELLKESGPSDKQPEIHLHWFLIPIMALVVLAGLTTLSILISKKTGWKNPGAGVIGSIIHYPRDMTDMADMND